MKRLHLHRQWVRRAGKKLYDLSCPQLGISCCSFTSRRKAERALEEAWARFLTYKRACQALDSARKNFA